MAYEVTIKSHEDLTLSEGKIHTVHNTQVFVFTDGETAMCFMETAAQHIKNFDSAVMEYVVALDDRDF